ncbi:MAG: hypothetical protein WAM30_11570 [Candidatus Dormiibacterota bacterium]
MPAWLSRVAPALLLVVLSPVVAEFLLGDFSVRSLYLLVILLPMYGGGALLLREIVRRTGRGWPTLLLLALAYGLLEEGVTTQSLFNPHYAGQHLLRFGYVPALGTSLHWDLFVLSLHVVWSIATPVLVAEGIAGERRTTPWLGRVGLVVAAALFAFGVVVTTLFGFVSSPFVASTPQFAAAGALIVVAIVVAFAGFRRRPEKAVASASNWLLAGGIALISLVLTSAFEITYQSLPAAGASPLVATAGSTACLIVLCAIVAVLSRRRGWAPLGYLGVATGTVLTYGWRGVEVMMRGRTDLGAPTGPIDVAAQVLLVLLVLALIGWGAWRNSRPAAQTANSTLAPAATPSTSSARP